MSHPTRGWLELVDSAEQLVLHHSHLTHACANEHGCAWPRLNLQPSNNRSVAPSALHEQLGVQLLGQRGVACIRAQRVGMPLHSTTVVRSVSVSRW